MKAADAARGAIALLSGGLDSVVAAAMWLDRGGAIVRCLSFDYGQRAAAREWQAAQRFCARHGLPLERVDLPWLAKLSERAGSALVARSRDLPTGTQQAPGDAASAAAVWVPARNCAFVSIAASYAEAYEAEAVLCGFNREEAATFPDNSAAFVAAGTAMLALGTRRQVVVASPTIDLDKLAIVAQARRLGVRREELWSCYRGGDAPCGVCESCLRSERAWSAQSAS